MKATEAIVLHARVVLERINAAPEVLGEVEGEWWNALHAAATDLRLALERHTDATHPDELRLVPRWIMEHAPAGETWWGRLGDTPGAFVTNGRAVLVVESCGDAPLEPSDRFPDRHTAHRMLAKLVDASRVGTRVEIPFERLDVPTPYLRIGPVVLNARLVSRWVLVAARASDMPPTIEITHGGELDGVLFNGAGWHAILMPTRATARRSADGVVLAEEPPCTVVVPAGDAR